MEIQGSREISARNRRSRSGSVGYRNRTVQYSTAGYVTVRYSSLQCCTLQNSVDQCNTEPYSTVH